MRFHFIFCCLLAVAVTAVSALSYCVAPLPVATPPLSGASLVHISVVTRHGDRAPTGPVVGGTENTPPTEWNCDTEDVLHFNPPAGSAGGTQYPSGVDIEATSTFGSLMWGGNCTEGQLTRLGAQQQVALGDALRAAYSSLVGDQFTSAMYARCDASPRTRDSAIGLLTGLFPNQATPIDIVQYPQTIETQSPPNLIACPAIAGVTSATQSSAAFKKLVASMANLTEEVTSVMGTAVGSNPLDLMSNLPNRYCHNMSLPCNTTTGACVNPAVVEPLVGNATILAMATWAPNLMQKLSSGPMIADIFRRINTTVISVSSSASSSPSPFALYSAHDSTVMGLLSAFDVWTDNQWPAYASSMVFEVWKQTSAAVASVPGRSNNKNNINDSSSSVDDYVLRIQYNGELKSLPWCAGATDCSLATTLKYIAANLTVNYPSDCM